MENWSRPARPGWASTIATFSGRKTDPEPGSLSLSLSLFLERERALVCWLRARSRSGNRRCSRPRGSERRSPAIFRPRNGSGVGVSLDTSFDALAARRHGHLRAAREQVKPVAPRVCLSSCWSHCQRLRPFVHRLCSLTSCPWPIPKKLENKIPYEFLARHLRSREKRWRSKEVYWGLLLLVNKYYDVYHYKLNLKVNNYYLFNLYAMICIISRVLAFYNWASNMFTAILFSSIAAVSFIWNARWYIITTFI